MSGFRLEPTADRSLDEIYDYTARTWGEEQADDYIAGLFEQFALIAERRVVWRALPAEFGLLGHVCRWRHHMIYWKEAYDGGPLIVAIIHERMHHGERLREVFNEP